MRGGRARSRGSGLSGRLSLLLGTLVMLQLAACWMLLFEHGARSTWSGSHPFAAEGRRGEQGDVSLMADGDALGMGMPPVPAFESRGSFESVRFGASAGQVYGHGRASTSSSLALSISSPTTGSFVGSQPAIPLVNPPLTTPGNHTPTISTTSVTTGDDEAERARTSARRS